MDAAEPAETGFAEVPQRAAGVGVHCRQLHNRRVIKPRFIARARQRQFLISVIVPLHNEGARVNAVVAHLRRLPGLAEAVLVDASNEAASLAVIEQLARRLHGDPRIRLMQGAARGRALQMNAGAAQCSGSTLLFLHCDTRLPSAAAEHIRRCITAGHAWGWFDVRLDAGGPAYRLLERMINLRARLSRIATGDQAMFIQQALFAGQRGFAEIALMEDVDMARRLKRAGRPGRIRQPVLTSARRWQNNGLLRTVVLMWKLRFLYWLGFEPARLARRYHDAR